MNAMTLFVAMMVSSFAQARTIDHEKATTGEVRGEQLMVRFDRVSSKAEAWRKIGKRGNEVLRGAELAAVARSGSHGTTARDGGRFDWTSIDNVKPLGITRQLRTLPKGRLSRIIVSETGYCIIRVIDRR